MQTELRLILKYGINGLSKPTESMGALRSSGGREGVLMVWQREMNQRNRDVVWVFPTGLEQGCVEATTERTLKIGELDDGDTRISVPNESRGGKNSSPFRDVFGFALVRSPPGVRKEFSMDDRCGHHDRSSDKDD